jgi:hypothetical protein
MGVLRQPRAALFCAKTRSAKSGKKLREKKNYRPWRSLNRDLQIRAAPFVAKPRSAPRKKKKGDTPPFRLAGCRDVSLPAETAQRLP